MHKHFTRLITGNCSVQMSRISEAFKTTEKILSWGCLSPAWNPGHIEPVHAAAACNSTLHGIDRSHTRTVNQSAVLLRPRTPRRGGEGRSPCHRVLSPKSVLKSLSDRIPEYRGRKARNAADVQRGSYSREIQEPLAPVAQPLATGSQLCVRLVLFRQG